MYIRQHYGKYITVMLKKLIRKLKDPEKVRAEDRARISLLLATLAETKTGAQLAAQMKSHKTRILYDERLPAGEAAYRAIGNSVALSPYGSEQAQLLSLGHELRHVWQEKQGLLLRRHIHIFDHVVNVRASEADAYATQVQIAWEQHKKDPRAGYWAAAKKDEGALCRVFEKVAQRSEKYVENGAARRAVFKAWLETAHCRQYDYKAMRAVRGYWKGKAQGQRQGFMFNMQRNDGQTPYMSEAFLKEFGQMANGQNYLQNMSLFKATRLMHTSAAQDRYIARTSEKYPGSDDSMIYDHL
ncbi:MAG: hypothetical protein CL561_07195 [Alphaproteobacteria bacterium]|nr:hypothetical protein [Alphaproteobacteria bacterium]